MTTNAQEREYVPALGQHWLTPLYDAAIAATTRENKWRAALIERLAPSAGDVVLDIGCGTGTLAGRIKHAAPAVTMIGIDPDPEVLKIAKSKADRRLLKIEFVEGFGDEIVEKLGSRGITKIVSSLVFHQVPFEGKESILCAAHDLLPSGGEIFVADFGEQKTGFMRACFKTVQRLDGYEYTQPNADGCLPILMKDVGFDDVKEELVLPTIVGSISLYTPRKN